MLFNAQHSTQRVVTESKTLIIVVGIGEKDVRIAANTVSSSTAITTGSRTKGVFVLVIHHFLVDPFEELISSKNVGPSQDTHQVRVVVPINVFQGVVVLLFGDSIEQTTILNRQMRPGTKSSLGGTPFRILRRMTINERRSSFLNIKRKVRNDKI